MRCNLQGKFVSQHTKCAPRHSKSQLFVLGGRGDLEVRVVDLVVLDRLSRATTKRSSTFFEKKSAPPNKILATPMSVSGPILSG